MPKKKQAETEDKGFTCSNLSCGLVFSKPLKVMNLREEDPQVYDACPRCLTVVAIQRSLVVETKPIEFGEKNVLERPEDETASREEKTGHVPAQCTHQFGYLSTRSKNEKIPDECMMCEDLVKCMTKTVSR